MRRPAVPYEETERHIRDRRERGLFADMRFTMARPEVSCHPELLLDGARTVVSAALCYYRPAREARAGEGRLPRYTWRDEYAELREKLEVLGRRLGGRYRVLVDHNDHVDRVAAIRAGVAFFGKNTMAITERHGSWVVLGALVTDVEIEATPALRFDCGECRLCIDACPTGALDDPGTLDATRCLSYWTQAPRTIPVEYRSELGAMVYGCDVCQEVCPWNRGVEKRRSGSPVAEDAQPFVRLADWLESRRRNARRRVRSPLRSTERRALAEAERARGGGQPRRGGARFADVERHASSSDPVVAEVAAWALGRMDERARA